jgi:cytochrome c
MTRFLFPTLAAFALCVAGSSLLGQAPPSGKDLFAKRCGGCHALDRDKEGPRLGGVYGRAAASVDSFAYSDALKKSKIEWNGGTLDRWLTDPDKVAPNNDMAFHVESAAERRAIIDYLKENSPR